MEDMEVSSSPEHVNDLHENNMAQLGIEEQGNETSLEDQPDTPEAALARAFEMSDKMPHKAELLRRIGDKFLAGRLNNFGISLRERFDSTGDVTDISEAILYLQKAVQLTSEGHAHLPIWLNNLGRWHQTRFQHTWDPTNISEAISYLQKAVQLTPEGHTYMSRWLNNLGELLELRFKCTWDLADISEAISCQRNAVQITPEGDVDLPIWLNNLRSFLQSRFECKGDFSDISEAMSHQQKAIQLTPEDHPNLPGLLCNLGNLLQTRFEHTGNLANISEAISYQQKAAQLTPKSHTDLVYRLTSLGLSLRMRFESTGDLSDISNAISYQQTAVQLTPEGHTNLPKYLSNLGCSLYRRFERIGNHSDISEAISYEQKAIQLSPEGYADLPRILANFGNSLQARYECTGELADISEAISYKRMAVEITPEGHPSLPGFQDSLGNSLQNRFAHTGDLSDLSEAISYGRKAVEITPEGRPDLPGRLGNLGHSLQKLFECSTGDLSDISEAITYLQKAIQLTPESHPNLSGLFCSVGNMLQARFERTGDVAEVSEAISYHQKAIQLTSEGHADLSGRLNNLGNSLRLRFERTRNFGDISEAIAYLQKAVQITPEGNAALPSRLSNLGSSLQARYERTQDLADITETISFQRKALQLTPEGHADLPTFLNNLGNSLQIRFESTGYVSDISEAISYHRKAVQLTPNGHAHLPGWLNNLGVSLHICFERTGDLANISDAISYQQKAVQLTPEGHARLPSFLSNLGSIFVARFARTADVEDITQAISRYRLSAISVAGPPSTRLASAKAWAVCARRRKDRPQMLEAYHTAIHLISQVAGLDQTIQNRHANLVNISKLSSSAAAAAIELGQHSLALEWLEQGRCLVWNQLNDLRTPIEDLRAHDPALADDILRVSRALENAGSREQPATYTIDTTMVTKMSIQAEAHTHIKLAQEWDQLLIKARAIPQFEDFLRPASCSTLLKNLPESGPVVVINIHQNRSDALVLMSGADQPLHIALCDFSYEQANNLRRQLTTHLLDSGVRMRGSEQLDDTRGLRYKTGGAVMKDVLEQLWTCVVKPILNGLGYSASPSNISRVWWCGNGPLAFLPIHAAGLYGPAESTPGIYTSLSDYAVSSYTPSIRSLTEKLRSSQQIKPENIGLLMISQPDTPKMPRIPGTTVEVGAIQRLLADHDIQHLCLESRDATVDRIKNIMNTHSCIHFACHASQDTTESLRSGFYLYDGRLELSQIIKEQLGGADLAFLSACQTSTGDEKLSEEAVHLAGGMLAAGYRGVVATMWSIRDDYGPKLAEEFYKNLVNQGREGEADSKRLNGDRAAYALHYATQEARKTLGNSDSSLLTWVPFVHFGL